MKFKVSEKKVYEKPCIEEGYYEAIFKEIKPISDGPEGKKRAVMVFELPTEEVSLGYFVNIYDTISEGSNLGSAVMALGVELTVDTEVSTDPLVGMKCRVLVENYVDNGKEASSISKVKPLLEKTEPTKEDYL